MRGTRTGWSSAKGLGGQLGGGAGTSSSVSLWQRSAREESVTVERMKLFHSQLFPHCTPGTHEAEAQLAEVGPKGPRQAQAYLSHKLVWGGTATPTALS